jgi:hypothetical protein
MSNKVTLADPRPPFVGGDVDIKEKVEHEENAYQEEHVALKSQFDDLTAWQALKTFKVVSLYCCAAAFSAATDGYQASRPCLKFLASILSTAHPIWLQININGNILANKGFIRQFGTTTDSTGAQILDAAWSKRSSAFAFRDAITYWTRSEPQFPLGAPSNP